MDNLLEEIKKYEDLKNNNESLNIELVSLLGKNDPDSISRINEIGSQLNKINTSLQKYDEEKIVKVQRYYETKKEFDRLVGELQTIEKLSKKSKDEKSETRSSEGRKKYIDNTLLEEYNLLASEKSKLQKRFNSEYKELEGITALIQNTPEVTENTEMVTTREYELPIRSYEELTPEEKQKETEERLQRIFNSTFLPNQGKKVIVTYDGKKYTIPKIYQGRFNETVRELNTLKKSMTSKETSKNEESKASPAPTPLEVAASLEAKLNELYDSLDKTTSAPVIATPAKKEEPFEEENPYLYGHYQPSIAPKKVTLPDLINLCEKNNITLHPVPVTLRRNNKINISKAFTCIKSKVSLENFKKLLPTVWNIDKQVILAFDKMNGKLIDKKIAIKTTTVNLANKAIHKYDSAKTYVTNIPKRTKEYIKGKYADFSNYFREKKEVTRLRKEEGYTRKSAMEEVYGEKVDKHLDYQIINRTVNFKENTCHRIKESNAFKTTKSVVEAIKKPFDYLRENMKNDVQRAELQARIDEVRRANIQKQEALKRIKVSTNAGYVGTVAITVIGVLALAAIIFIGIGSIINR